MLDWTASAERRIARSVNPVDPRTPVPPLRARMRRARHAGERHAFARAAQFGSVASAHAPASTFEALTGFTAQLPRGAADVFGALLASAYPQRLDARWAPRPLWNEEAIHRAYRLLLLLQRLRMHRPDNGHDWHNELGLAVQLAVDVRSLSAAPENQLMPCSVVLRSVLRGLSALFGPAAGDIDLRTNIARISLPAYRRRALVLAATELVINAISHAFHGHSDGRIEVSLACISEDRARLRIADDGIGHADEADSLISLAGRLGCLLEGRLSYRHDRAWATVAELVFPRLQHRELTRKKYAKGTLRDRLGLPPPVTRFGSRVTPMG